MEQNERRGEGVERQHKSSEEEELARPSSPIGRAEGGGGGGSSPKSETQPQELGEEEKLLQSAAANAAADCYRPTSAEMTTQGRKRRRDEVRGVGSNREVRSDDAVVWARTCKDVYKAFDEEEGMDVVESN